MKRKKKKKNFFLYIFFIYTYSPPTGPLPMSKGFRYLLTAKDLFTKWVELIPVKDLHATTIAKAINDQIFCRFGLPGAMHFDNGKSRKHTKQGKTNCLYYFFFVVEQASTSPVTSSRNSWTSLESQERSLHLIRQSPIPSRELIGT